MDRGGKLSASATDSRFWILDSKKLPDSDHIIFTAGSFFLNICFSKQTSYFLVGFFKTNPPKKDIYNVYLSEESILYFHLLYISEISLI